MAIYKCCNYTDNTNPTIDEIKAIESKWNSFINTYFTAVDDKYPSTDLTNISQATAIIIRGADGNSKKNSNGQPMFTVENDDGDIVELAREEVNALRLKSHIWNTDDTEISHSVSLTVDSLGLMIAMGVNEEQMDDKTLPDPDDATNTVLAKGLITHLSEGRVKIRTHEGHFKFGDYKKEEIFYKVDAD